MRHPNMAKKSRSVRVYGLAKFLFSKPVSLVTKQSKVTWGQIATFNIVMAPDAKSQDYYKTCTSNLCQFLYNINWANFLNLSQGSEIKICITQYFSHPILHERCIKTTAGWLGNVNFEEYTFISRIYTANNRGICVSWIYIFVLDIFCQQLGDIWQLEGVCAPFRALGWGTCVSWKYIFVLDIFCQQLGDIYI